MCEGGGGPQYVSKYVRNRNNSLFSVYRPQFLPPPSSCLGVCQAFGYVYSSVVSFLCWSCRRVYRKHVLTSTRRIIAGNISIDPTSMVARQTERHSPVLMCSGTSRAIQKIHSDFEKKHTLIREQPLHAWLPKEITPRRGSIRNTQEPTTRKCKKREPISLDTYGIFL